MFSRVFKLIVLTKFSSDAVGASDIRRLEQSAYFLYPCGLLKRPCFGYLELPENRTRDHRATAHSKRFPATPSASRININ